MKNANVLAVANKRDLVELVKVYGYTEIECDGTYLYNFSEMIQEEWDELASLTFISQWNGSTERIDSQVVEFHNEFYQTA
jgi:hypothetical protein